MQLQNPILFQNSLNLLLPSILIVPTIAFFFIFLRYSRQTRLRMFKSLVALFGLFIVHNFFALTQVFIAGIYPELASIAFVISAVFFELTLLFFVIVLEMFEKHNPFSTRIVIFTAIAAAIIGEMLITTPATSSDGTISFQGSPVANVQAFFGLITTIWFFVTFYRSRRDARSKAQRRLVFLLAIGIFLTLAISGAATQVYPQVLGSTQPLNSSVGQFGSGQVVSGIEFIGNIGMLLVGWGFYRVSKRPWLLQRQMVHLLLVFSKEGYNLFSITFSKDITKNDMTLLSGAFSAISTIFKETTKTQSQVQAILFEGRELRLLSRTNFIVALLVDYDTQASYLALQKFTEEFENQFGYALDDFDGNVEKLQGAKDIAAKYFS